MSININQAVLGGRLATDPELKFTANGKAICNFRLAVTTGKDTTSFFTVSAWEKLAETAAQYLAKGKTVVVTGRISIREWEGKEGDKRNTVEVNASTIGFDGPKESGGRDSGTVDPDGEIPFN